MAYTFPTAQTSPGVQSFWDMTQPQNAYSTIQNGMDAGYQFSNFNGMPTLTGDKYMGGLNSALDLYNNATGQSLTAQQYDQMINPSSSGARWGADGGQTGSADYANAGQVLGTNIPLYTGTGGAEMGGLGNAPKLGGGGGNGGGGGRPPGAGLGGDYGMGSNPYQGAQADALAAQQQTFLDRNLAGIRSNSVGVGGLGGSRQGVAQGQAIGDAATGLAGATANLYGSNWQADQNRELQRYGMDQGFYTANRGLDQSGVALGANLYGLANNGDWSGLNNANNIYSPWSGFGTSTTGAQSGGGWQGGLGGAIGGATLGRNMGWW